MMNGEQENLRGSNGDEHGQDIGFNDKDENSQSYGDSSKDNENYTDTEEDLEEDNDDYYKQPIKFKIPFPIIAFLLIVLVLDIISMMRFPKVLDEYKIYALAEDRIKNGETSEAIGDLYDIAEKHSKSVPIMMRLVDLSMENGYYDTAGYIVDIYLVGRNVSDAEYNRLDSYYVKLENYYTTYDAIEQISNAASSQGTAEEIDFDIIQEQLLDLLEQDGQDYAYLYYYLGILEGDAVVSRDYMQQSYNYDPNCFDVRSQLSILNRRLGNLEKAKFYAEEALSKDKKDTGALRAMATISLVEGKLEEGLQYALEAYDLYPEGMYIRDTYAIALYANGMTSESKQIQEELIALGETLEEDTAQFLNGEITLEQYYIVE